MIEQPQDTTGSNNKNEIGISHNDLPLCCPLPSMMHWNYHPRVFLEIEKSTTNSIICPYCSTKYVLIND